MLFGRRVTVRCEGPAGLPGRYRFLRVEGDQFYFCPDRAGEPVFSAGPRTLLAGAALNRFDGDALSQPPYAE